MITCDDMWWNVLGTKTLHIHTQVASPKNNKNNVRGGHISDISRKSDGVCWCWESVSRGHGGCLGSCASSGRGSRTRVACIGNRNPKEHVMIVTGMFGYVIVVVESIDHAVVLLEEFWSLCTASWTEASFGDLLLWFTLVDNDAKHQTDEKRHSRQWCRRGIGARFIRPVTRM